MKLINIGLLSAAAALTIIGIYESFVWGISGAYWAFMCAAACIFAYIIRKRV